MPQGTKNEDARTTLSSCEQVIRKLQWLRQEPPGKTKLGSVTNPRLFATRHRPPQLKLFALNEALGAGGWLKALGLEAYAPRSRGRPEALQGALFSYLEAL